MVDVEKALRGAAHAQSQSDDVPANEFVRKLMSRKRPSEVLPFPRVGQDGKPLFEYRMCVLSQQELDGCLYDAEMYAQRMFKDKKRPSSDELGAVRGEAWSEVYNNAKIVEILLRACRQVPEKTNPAGKVYHDPLFIGGDQIRGLLTSDELASMFNAYLNTQFRFGPLWRYMTDDQVDAFVDRLEEGLSDSPLSHLEQGQLIVLVASLAARNRTLRMGTGSSGLPSESGTPNDSQTTPG